MLIRRATYEEAKSIKSFDVFLGDRRIDNWRGELFVCIDGQEVAGYIAYSSNLFYNRPYIAQLCVKESHRRKGIARQLVQRVLAIYEGLDVWVSTEDWNQPAVALFEGAGFKRMGEITGLNRDESREIFFVFRDPHPLIPA
ncbi:MAG TPA: GNAT family N-acetyltransferase [Tepidisphaeraceae bacterium]|jgi:ribosomal protein S18 acetylase RimI-like enzyme|nr:GNAT family N-acetyltransferase [Tepidisphaeraceae bacterium]